MTGVLLVVLGTALAAWWWHDSSWKLRLERLSGDGKPTEEVRLTQRLRTAASQRAPEIAPHERWPAGAEVRNVILLIGDGLGLSQVQAARADLVGLDGRLGFERMPFTGLVSTHSWTGAITDSAAGATSMATGQKTLNGRVGVDTEGRPLKTVAEVARDRGMAVGLVTSSYLVDATPAAFVAHLQSRRDYDQIADQMADSGVDLLLGENRSSLEAPELERRIERFKAGGFAVHRDWNSLAAAGTEPVAGLFDPGVIADPERVPSLVDLTTLALDRLSAAPGGYFLMIEEEETDTGSHRADWPRVRRGVATLDACAELAIAAARADGHTLVLLTADHETGHFGIHSGRQGKALGVRFDNDDHTGVPVPIYAFGPGAERFTGVLDNTDVAWRVAELLGLELGRLDAAAPSSVEDR